MYKCIWLHPCNQLPLLVEQLLRSFLMILWLFHQSSALYNTMDCTTTSWIWQISSAISSCIFFRLLIWISVFQALSNILIICKVNLTRLSSHTSSQRIASSLNEIFLLSNLIFASRRWLLSCCQCDLEKSRAFVFTIFYVTAFSLFHFITSWPQFLRAITNFLTELPEALKP